MSGKVRLIMQTMPIKIDIEVQTARGDPLALVEVKNFEILTRKMASTIRLNLLAHAPADWWSKFFMIVSQDAGYLWEQGSHPSTEELPPAVEFSMVPVVGRYLPSFANGGRLWKTQLELAVTQWLWDLALGREDHSQEPEKTLATTDFLLCIRGGRVTLESDL
jgi:hypothetical protein